MRPNPRVAAGASSGAMKEGECQPGEIPVRQHPACRSSIAFRSIPFRPSRRPAARSGTLIRAYPARAPVLVGARFAPARFARLIARMRPREPDAGRTSPVGRIGGFFRAGANGGTKRPRERRSLPPAAHCNTIFDNASNFRIISEKQNMILHSGSAGAGRLWMRTRSATIGGQGEPMASDIANDCAGPPSNGVPPALRRAHRNLDRAVDRLYRPTPWPPNASA